MKKIFNDKDSKNRRKNLRNNSTEVEQILWFHLRKSQLGGYKFRRQQGIGKYIADFYSSSKRLVVELDGGQHNELRNKEYDLDRTKYFNGLGIKVLRFWDNDVTENIEGVLEKILHELTTS